MRERSTATSTVAPEGSNSSSSRAATAWPTTQAVPARSSGSCLEPAGRDKVTATMVPQGRASTAR